MSKTVKLIIEIPAETYEYWKTHRDEYVLAEAIGNGIPLDTVKDKILGYNVRQHVSGSESFLKGYAVGMDKSAEILDKISAEITKKAFTEEIFDEDIFRSTYTESMTREEAECESVIETEIVKLSDVLEIIDNIGKGDKG